MAGESKPKQESRPAKSPMKRTESVRRAEVREFLQHLTTKKRLITTEKEGREWAESVQSFVTEERVRRGPAYVHPVTYYAKRGQAVAAVFEAARSQIGRDCKRAGLVVRVEDGGKLRRSDYISQFVPDEKCLVQEIMYVLDQGRTNFVAHQATDLKLIKSGTAGPGETNNKGQQQEQLVFLASYGRDNPAYSLADFFTGHLASFHPAKLDRWFEVQQEQIVPLNGCVDWKTFRRLCLDQHLGEWFRGVYAHQWYLYRTGYFLEQLAYLANFTMNFQISPPREDPKVVALLDEVRETLFDVHAKVADSRLLLDDLGEQ